jgi:hypothetical protein
MLEKQKSFSCEIPASKENKPPKRVKVTPPLSKESQMKSPYCEEYKKKSKKSDFEFPCYVKCDTFIGE